MKHIVFISAFLAIAVPFFVACTDNEIGNTDATQQNVSRTSVGIIAGIVLPETKTTIEGDKNRGFLISWEADDKLGVFTHSNDVEIQYHSLNEPFNIRDGINDDGSATFAGTLNCHTNDVITVDMYAYYPYSRVNDRVEYSAATSEIPSIQTMTENGSHHYGADIMIADCKKGIEIPQEGKAFEPVSDFKFRYVVSFVNVSISHIASGDDAPRFPVAGTEIVKSIKLGVTSANGDDPALSGGVSLDLASATASANGKNYNYVVASWPAGVDKTIADICGEGKLGAWLVTLPFSVGGENGNSLVITIETDKNRIVKKVLPDKTLEFIAGGVKTLNVAIDSNCEIIPAGDIFSETFGRGLVWTGDPVSSSFGDYSKLVNGLDRGGWGGSEVSYLTTGIIEIRRTESFFEHLYMTKESRFTIAGITVGSLRDFTLSYKHCIVSSNPSATTTYTLSVSNDGSNWKPLAGTTGEETVKGTDYVVKQWPFSVSSGSDKLYLKFEVSSAYNHQIRIDDILLTAADGVQEKIIDLNPIQVSTIK